MWTGKIRVAGQDVQICGPDEARAEVNACLTWLANHAGGTLLQSMPDKVPDIEYNGWPNQETWAAYSWIGANEESYNEARAAVERAKSWGDAIDAIQNIIAGSNPLIDQASIYGDLMNVALGRIDYARIIKSCGNKKYGPGIKNW